MDSHFIDHSLNFKDHFENFMEHFLYFIDCSLYCYGSFFLFYFINHSMDHIDHFMEVIKFRNFFTFRQRLRIQMTAFRFSVLLLRNTAKLSIDLLAISHRQFIALNMQKNIFLQGTAKTAKKNKDPVLKFIVAKFKIKVLPAGFFTADKSFFVRFPPDLCSID